MTAPLSLSPEEKTLLLESLELLEKALTDFILKEEDWITQARHGSTHVSAKLRHEAMELSQRKRAQLTEVAALHGRIKAAR